MSDLGSINKVILLGYLGADPELQKDLNSQSYFCVLSIATKEYFKGKDGEKDKRPTTWHRCVVWGAMATNIAKFGKAGTLVALEGKIKRKQWTTKDGDKRQRVEISVDKLTIVGGKTKHQVDDPPEETPEQDDFDPEEEKRDDPY